MRKSPSFLVISLLLSLAALPPPAHAGDTGGLRGPVRGEQAISLLGDRLDEAAAANGWSAAHLREVLRTDSRAWLDSAGRVFYVEPVATGGAAAPGVAGVAPFPVDQTFLLHSRPASTHVLFLDFDGTTVSGTAWNSAKLPNGFYSGYSLDSDLSTFSSAEREEIQKIWQRVSEDYAPFDVDVTTQDPGAAAIDRTSSSDQSFGTRALITEDTTASAAICNNSCGGVAYVDVFDQTGSSHAIHQPAWIFAHLLAGNDTKDIAEAVSHEVGHQFGLSHDGRTSPAEGYYEGHNAWAPIMGVGYSMPIVQWSKGEYASANNTENDLAIIASSGAPLVADEAGSTVDTAAAGIPAQAYITSASDTDTYALDTCSGTVTLSAAGAVPSPDLDIQLELLDSSGTTVALADPPSAYLSRDSAGGLGATLTTDVPSGTYYARVDGVGNGTASTGYTDYASIGAYTLTVDGCSSEEAPSAPTGLVVTPDPSGTSAVATWAAPGSDGGSPVTGYEVSLAGGPSETQVELSKTWSGLTPGASYLVSVAATNAVGTGEPATRTVTMPPTTAPATPTVPSAPRLRRPRGGKQGGKVTASIRWHVPPNGGAPITAYEVLVLKGRHGRVIERATVPTSATSYVARLRPGRYRFQVAAVNAVGTGPLSALSKAVVAA